LCLFRAFGEQQRFVNQLCEKVDSNTSAFLLLQSGCRWLGIALDAAGAVAVLASVLASLAAASAANGEAPSASVGLSMNYSLLVPVYLAWVVKFLADIEVGSSANIVAVVVVVALVVVSSGGGGGGP